MDNATKTKTLVATQDFTDKQGTKRRKDEQFQAQNDQEAQEYIRQGQAREATESQQQQKQR